MAKLPYTPNGRIKDALRKLFLRSRERHTVLKRTNYCCEKCGIKQTKAGKDEKFWVKVNVHHNDGIDWDDIIMYIRKQLLVDPEKMTALCEECHGKEHDIDFEG